jgi:predicted DNA-binding transcriptional regulator AlpA
LRNFAVRTKRSTIPHQIVISDDATLMTSGELRDYFRVSPMWIDRKLKNDPTFPRPLCLGPRTRRWVRADIAAWAEKHWAAWPEVQATKRTERTVQP